MSAELVSQKIIILGTEVSERTPSGDLIIIDVDSGDHKEKPFLQVNKPTKKAEWLEAVQVTQPKVEFKPELPPDHGW